MVYNRKLIIRNLNSLLNEASPADIVAGVEWYPTARRTIAGIADTYGISMVRACLLVAAASPQMGWLDNIAIVVSHLRGERASKATGDVLATMRRVSDCAEERLGTHLLTAFKRDRKSTRLNSSHVSESRMPSSA